MTSSMAGGKPTSPPPVGIYSQSDHSIVVHDNDPNTNLNVDLSDHGNANPRTPITLWGQWGGKHQVWEFQQA